MRKSLRERFEEKFERRGDDECWPWTKATNGVGYGQMWDPSRRRLVLAHRLAWEMYRGPIPEGFEIDHQCHTPDCKLIADCPHRACVNARHLKPMTHQRNGLRGNGMYAANSRKDRCKRDHEFTPENTFIQQGARQCLACRRLRDAKRKSGWVRQREAAARINGSPVNPAKYV